ncbi:hypothetical protein [Streptomyces sp. NPDC126499]|uniref:hypothetical protein n=1 Tax=Streptomyces sp. NPDC126499 TaxID=3155314 RepID=UPI003330C35F
MRPQASRRLTVLAISAVLTLGTAGPAVADELRPPRPATHAGPRLQLPDSSALLARAEALKADDGRISAVDAEALRAEIKAAVDAAKAAAPAGFPAGPAVGKAAAAADPIGDGLATVQKAIADLLAAVSSVGPTGVVDTVGNTLNALVDLVMSTLALGGIPKPDLPGMTGLGQLPAQAPAQAPVEKPAAPPATAELPVKPPSTPELPVKPVKPAVPAKPAMPAVPVMPAKPAMPAVPVMPDR